jgi:hypothetical protein
MDETPHFYQQPGFWRKLVFWGVFLLFIFAFWNEIRVTLSILLIYLTTLISCRNNLLPLPACINLLVGIKLDAATLRSIFLVGMNVIVYLVIAIFSIYQIAQFALPVRTGEERSKAFNRLLLYLRGNHGPAIFAKEGRANSREDEAQSIRPGVALVDLSSAIVLEQQGNPRAWQFQRWQQEQTGATKEIGGITVKKTFKKSDKKTQAWVRVAGPGVVFTEGGEKIHSVVDLRKQVRIQPDVQAFTRDGIELKMPVITVFSLSEAPEVIPVAYIDGQNAENLYGLKFGDAKEPKTTKITGIFELDSDDQAEIHSFVQYGSKYVEKRTTQAADKYQTKTPYPFHENRVFAAAYSQALVSSSKPTVWHELPLQVAIDIFRKEMVLYNFDDLLKTNQPNIFPLLDIKENFSRKVRFQGLLSYKLVHKLVERGETSNNDQQETEWNEEIFVTSDIGQTFKTSHIKISPAHELHNSKILRDRGIRVITATFPEFRVAEEKVKEKLIEHWKARWEREIDITRAQHELEAMRERSRARAQTQSEMTYVLSNLFQTTPHSKEALALRIFQALEKAAASELDPKEVLAMLRNLHRWLLIEYKEKPKDQHRDSGNDFELDS